MIFGVFYYQTMNFAISGDVKHVPSATPLEAAHGFE
jgi:hypothetical protein